MVAPWTLQRSTRSRLFLYVLFGCVGTCIFVVIRHNNISDNISEKRVGDYGPLEAISGQRFQSYTTGYSCSEDEIKSNAVFKGKSPTGCPVEPWYWEWRSHIQSDRPTYIEVGCNKATDAIMNLRAFTADPRVDIDVWLEETHFKGFACPFDRKQWEQVVRDNRTRSSTYRHFCIEAAVENARPVKEVAQKLGYDKLGLLSHHYAVSSSSFPAQVKFPAIDAGVEAVGMDTNNTRFEKFYEVPVTSIDEFVNTNNIEQVDVLKIDTEGNDPLVIIGAVNTLAHMKPGYLQFENHGVGRWATWDLKDVIDLLDHLSYECFWATNSGQLIRLTSCWSNDYGTEKGWSNVACYHREEKLLSQIMESPRYSGRKLSEGSLNK